MGVIMEWAVDMSVSAAYRVSKNSSIVELNIAESWYICGRRLFVVDVQNIYSIVQG